MYKHTRQILFISCLLLLLAGGAWLHFRREGASGQAQIYTVAVFNTVGRISLWGVDQATAAAAVRDLAAEWQQLHNALNVFDPNSEVSRCNATAAATPFVCTPLLWGALERSAVAWKLTDGYFDITVAPLLQLWKERAQTGCPPDADALATVMCRVGFGHLRLDPAQRSVSYAVPGMAVNFGGMAKGYALDLARERLAQRGLACYLLDLGGNILAGPQPPPGRRSFSIGLRHPQAREDILGAIELIGEVISTSANYERGLTMGAKQIGHIVDPRTGLTVQGMEAVSAIARSGCDADVFSTAVFIGGAKLAEALTKRVPGSRFILVSRQSDGSFACQHFGPTP